MSDKKIFSLSSVAKAIRNVVETHCSRTMWVKAEIVKLNHYHQSGHCYPTLIEKKDKHIVAEFRGTIWKADFIKINSKFRSVLKQDLGDEMSVVMLATITFHPVYGLSLLIKDIDPSFTLGELARQKAETISRLKKEQLFLLNKQKKMAIIPKRIAVISVETSKGFQDFLKVINENEMGFKFHISLFPAILQGEKAISTISAQLDFIKEKRDYFDIVAIIRGGGGEVGLSAFDSYELSKIVAAFPIPILTGIGHSTNETVTEMVSHQSFITPTKIGDFLIERYRLFLQNLIEIENFLGNSSSKMINAEKERFQSDKKLFLLLAKNYLTFEKTELKDLGSKLLQQSRYIVKDEFQKIDIFKDRIFYFQKNLYQTELNNLSKISENIRFSQQILLESNKQQLQFLEEKIDILSPKNILKRGFSITRFKGKAIKSTELLNIGEQLETELYNGKISSVIKDKKEK